MIRSAGSRRSKRTYVALMTANAVALAAPLVPLYYILMVHYQVDLDVYRIGAQVWRSGGNLYGPMPPTQSGMGLPFTYPPIAAVLLSPLTLVPMKVAGLLLGLLTAGLVAVVLGMFLRSLGSLSNDRLRWTVAALLPVALVLEPVRSTLGFGQVNVVLMALVTVDCLVQKPRWPRGMLVGLAAAMKLTPAVFLLFFLLRRDYRATVVGILSALATTGIGFLLAWDSSVEYWTSTLFDTGRIGASHYTSNQDIMAVLGRLGMESGVRNALWLLLSLVVLALAAVGIRRAFAVSRDTVALILNALAALLVSPVSWSHHWVWGIPAVLTLTVVGLRARAQLPIGLATTGAVLFMVSPHWWFPHAADRELQWNGWQQIVGSSYVYFAATVLIVAAFGKSLWREYATDNPVNQAGAATAETSARGTSQPPRSSDSTVGVPGLGHRLR